VVVEPARHKVDFYIGKKGLRTKWRLALYLVIVVGSGVVIAQVAQMIFHPHSGGMMTAWI
jgi:hypothetical protein